MPLIPPIRPVKSINNTAESPIIPPPIIAETGEKLAMTVHPAIQRRPRSSIVISSERRATRIVSRNWL
jgi:hypothetical protein